VAGLRILPHLALEGRVSVLAEEILSNLELLHAEGDVTFLLWPTRRLNPFVTAGAGGIRADRDSGASDTFAWSAGGGLLVRITDLVGVRVDGRRVTYRVNYLGEKAFRPQPEVFAGLHFGLGGASARPPDHNHAP
jgi:hypothetical protein